MSTLDGPSAAVGVLVGAAIVMIVFGISYLWDLVKAELKSRDVSALADAVGVFDIEDQLICDDCKTPLTPDNTAVTCGVHDLCVDCDAHSNEACNGCRSARFHAGADGHYDWALEGWLT